MLNNQKTGTNLVASNKELVNQEFYPFMEDIYDNLYNPEMCAVESFTKYNE